MLRSLIGVLSLCVAIAAWGALQICEKCGHEIPDQAKTCEHCGAVNPVVASANDKRASEESSASANSAIAPSLIESEILAAVEQINKGDLEIADMLLRNASWLTLVSTDPSADEKAKRIRELRTRCQQGPSSTSVPCSSCGGTGKKTMTVTSLATGKTETKEAHGMVCDACKGSGKVARASTIDEVKFSRAQAGRRFAEFQRARRFEVLGGAWVPSGTGDKMTIKEKVVLKSAAAPSCMECQGMGREDCTKCGGKGQIKCTNAKCEGGKIVIVVEGSLAKGKLTRSEPCKECGGDGLISCAACSGKGSVVCKVCKGSGDRPVCAKCGGEGTAACRKCSGTGSVNDLVCPVCKGQGLELCATCNGEGKK